MATEKKVIGQAQRILVDATNQIWHRISLWTHASDVEMPNGDPLNQYLTSMNDEINENFNAKYNSYNMKTTGINDLAQIPSIGYSRIQTLAPITAGEYTIPANHFCYCYSGEDPHSIEKMSVMIDTTDLTSIVMYIAHYSIEAKWTLTKIATQKQIDDLQDQIDELNVSFNQLNLYVQSSIGYLNSQYQVIQNQMDWLEAELAELQEFLNDLLNELRDFKAEMRGKVGALYGLYEQIGSIYLTTSPTLGGRLVYEYLEEVFGGKWVLVQDAYLYAGHWAGHDGVPQDYDNDNAQVWTPGDDNYSRMRGWQAGFSGDASGPRDRMARDYSQIYQGRDEFVLDKSNIPEHRHRVNEEPYKKGIGITYQVRGDYDSFTQDAWADIPIAGGDSDYLTVGIKKSVLGSPGRPGVGFIEPLTGPNSFPNEPLSQPVRLNPTRFKVYVWCKIA